MERHPLRPALLSLLLLGCPAVDTPDAAVDAGGTRACSFAVNPWASTVLEIGVVHPVPTFAIDPDSGTCLESGQLSLARVDAPGSGRVFWSADGGLFVEASSGGVYVLRVDEYSVFSNELYFAKRAVLSAHWAEPCAEVRRLENDVWSCGGKLYSDGGVVSDGASRWLAVPDSGIASQWEDGIHVAPLASADAGPLVFSIQDVQAWAAAEDGMSVVSTSGVYDCRWGTPTCALLVSGLGPPSPVPGYVESIAAVLRIEGRTFFTRYGSENAWCDANSGRCWNQSAGIAAANGRAFWQISPFVFEGRGYSFAKLGWDAGFTFLAGEFRAPPDFRIATPRSGVPPAGLLTASDAQMLLWRWDGDGEQFHFVDTSKSRSAFGAEPSFFWYATDAETFIFAD
ncbi:MAG: hypothetical protein AB1938_30740 [Myxococcota bacterium]